MRQRLSVEKRREQIKRAAESLFFRHGYSAVDIEMIRNAVELSRGGFYHHFAAKSEILAEIVRDEVIALLASTDGNATGLAAFHALVLNGGIHAGAEPGILATLGHDDDRALYLSFLESSLQEHLRPYLIRIVADGIQSGEFSDTPAEHVADLFLSINALINRNEVLGDWSEKQSRAFARTALKALGLLIGCPIHNLFATGTTD